jgi:pimeloyl-ACP methyl ester carboxylesterase
VAERVIDAGGGVTLAVTDDEGEGTPIVLLHGLTAARRYVVMGSHALQRAGHRVVAYDARGHGASSPAPTQDAYSYEDLSRDLAAVLDAAGLGMADVVKTTIFLADMADFAAVNAVYQRHLPDPPPARSTIQVAALPKDGRVEIEAVAARPAGDRGGR